MKVVTAKEIQELDRRAEAEYGISSLILMENAGAGAVRAMEQHFPRLYRSRVVVVCGKGNNGGDGLVVARGRGPPQAWRAPCRCRSDCRCDPRDWPHRAGPGDRRRGDPAPQWPRATPRGFRSPLRPRLRRA